MTTRRSPAITCAPLVLATFAVGTDAWVVAGFLPSMAGDLHVSESAAGISVIAFAVAYSVAAPLLAAVTAQFPRRRVLVAALITLALANAATAWAPDLGVLLATRAIAGAAASVVTPTAGVIAATAVPAIYRARALAVVIAGLTLATAIGVPSASLLSNLVSWRVSLICVSALCALCAGAVLSLIRPSPATQAPRLRERFAPLADPYIRRVLLLTLVGMAAAYCPYAFFGQATGTTGTELPIALAGYGIGAVIGSLASGRYTDLVGPGRTLATAYITMALALAVIATHGPFMIVMIATALWGAASWAQTPPQQHRLLTHESANATMVIGMNASALYMGVAVGTIVGSILITVDRVITIAAAVGLAVCAAALNSMASRRASSPRDNGLKANQANRER